MEQVQFITVEPGEDLIVSFVVLAEGAGDATLSEVESIILMRTKYEYLLDDSERGVKVSHERYSEEEDALLTEIEFVGDEVKIKTTGRSYYLNVRRVDDGEIEEARKKLKEMNFDGRFKIKNV